MQGYFFFQILLHTVEDPEDTAVFVMYLFVFPHSRDFFLGDL